MQKPIVIVGAGPAGTVCAMSLAARGYPVILATSTHQRPSYGETCSSRAIEALEAVCGSAVPATVGSPLDTFASAWGSAALQVRQLPHRSPSPHYLLSRPALDEWLLVKAAAAGITIVSDCTVEQGPVAGVAWQLRCRTTSLPTSIEASYVVEATGRAGRAALQPGIHRHYLDALVCASLEVIPPRPLPVTLAGAVVEPCRQGWWYMVRQPGGALTLCFFTDADLLPTAVHQRDWLMAQLSSTVHLAWLADSILPETAIQVCEARTSVRHALWQDKWLCIGDAAWCMDPLSGTGIERAIRSASMAAASLTAAIEAYGRTDHLRHFANLQGQAFQQMLSSRRWYYKQEMRWSSASFWRRRH